MKETTITFHTAFQIGEVDPRIFGGFLEHMGRAVYEGVYQPDSAHADAYGWRSDVLAALEGLRYWETAGLLLNCHLFPSSRRRF